MSGVGHELLSGSVVLNLVPSWSLHVRCEVVIGTLMYGQISGAVNPTIFTDLVTIRAREFLRLY